MPRAPSIATATLLLACADATTRTDHALTAATADFDVDSVAAFDSEGGVLVSFSDVATDQACSLAEGEDVAPRHGGHRILVNAGSGAWPCPEGVVDLGASCEGTVDSEPGCAVYQAWDADGDPSARTAASSGSITFTPVRYGRCLVELEVSFGADPAEYHSVELEFDPDAPTDRLCWVAPPE